MPKRRRSFTAEFFNKDGTLVYTTQVYGETRSEAQQVALQLMCQWELNSVRVDHPWD